MRSRVIFWGGDIIARIHQGHSSIDPICQLRWLGGWANLHSSVVVGANYAFWTARLRDMRAALENEMEDTVSGKRYPTEYTRAIYMLVSHLYTEDKTYVGWQTDAIGQNRRIVPGDVVP